MRKRPNPQGWKGGSEDFTFLSATRGRLAEDHFGHEDAYNYNRNDQTFSEYDWGDCDYTEEDVEYKSSSPYRSGRS